MFNINDWNVIGEYVYDGEGGRHQAFYSPKKDVTCIGVRIQEGERVQVEQSLKYSADGRRILWEQASLKEIKKWSASTESYSTCLFTLYTITAGHSSVQIRARRVVRILVIDLVELSDHRGNRS